MRNLQRLAAEGFPRQRRLLRGHRTTRRCQRRGRPHVVVRSFMAHHQGNKPAGAGSRALGRLMQQRFEFDRALQATAAAAGADASELFRTPPRPSATPTARCQPATRHDRLHRPTPRCPEVQLLSNGRYHVMVSNAGGGSAGSDNAGVTRWRGTAPAMTGAPATIPRLVASGRLVRRPPADPAPPDQLRGDPLGRPGRVRRRRRSGTRRRHRDLPPRSSSPRRRHRLRAGCASPTAAAARGDRDHQLRRGGDRPARRRRPPSRLQQLRADRILPRQRRASNARAGRARADEATPGCST